MSNEFKIEGLEEFQNELKRIGDGINDLSGETKVSFEELFNNVFMSRYTNFSTIKELLDVYDKDLNEEQIAEVLESKKWNEFIKENTKFDSWEDMYEKSGELYLENKIKNIFG